MAPLGGLIALVVLWLVWGTSWPAMRTVFLELPVWQFRAVTCAVGGIVLLGLGMMQDRGRWKAPRRIWPRLILAAFLNMTCLAHSGRLRPADRRRRPCRHCLLHPAGVDGVAGRPVLRRTDLGADAGRPGSGDRGCRRSAVRRFRCVRRLVRGEQPLGFAFVLLAAITWAAGTLVVKHYDWGVSMNAMAGWQLADRSDPDCPDRFRQRAICAAPRQPGGHLAGFYVLFVAIVMGYALWFRVVQSMPVTVASIGTMMIPVIGLASGALMLGEPFGWREFLALALVLSAIALVLFFPARRQSGSMDRAG